MADDKGIWSSNHITYTPYPVSTYLNSHAQLEQWHDQVKYRPSTPYTPVLSTYNHVAPNINPFSRYVHGSGLNPLPCQYSDNLDAEVSYYNNFTGFEPSSHIYDDNRCSSTDTTVSSSSVSTVFSHGSVDTDFSHDPEQTGQKRKREKQRKKTSKKSRKDNSNGNYKRWPKPPYSYCGLIIVAIQISPKKELTLQGIHAALMELFPFFRGSYLGWRDSVRHNLSHSSCFVKIPCIPPNKVCRWTVDWSKVTPAMFARQQSKVSQSDLYKATIHEHLGLERYESETHTSEERAEFKETHMTPRQPKQKKEPFLTPQMSDVRSFSVTLPSVDKCEKQSDSPYQFRAHDSTPSNIVSTSSEDITQFSTTSPVITPSSGSYTLDFDSFWNMIMSERRSSLDAAHHLHTLCTSVDQPPPSEPGSDLPPLSRDSDVYLPLSPVNSAHVPFVTPSTSAYTDPDFITISPCKTLVTSFLASDIEESTRGRTVAEPSMSVQAAQSDDENEEDIRIIDI
ncbi:forkhead activin signal transducer 3-like [Mercenaria mercenaria]|uniref:forkhead activin signal transducer 3-like n=1 Tax=Mercenaria mercenaria TaxID=6596 RepID=UPI00234E7EEA|nr:forkhead activin signal transducer 3-like [Mercenaria mercenaria]